MPHLRQQGVAQRSTSSAPPQLRVSDHIALGRFGSLDRGNRATLTLLIARQSCAITVSQFLTDRAIDVGIGDDLRLEMLTPAKNNRHDGIAMGYWPSTSPRARYPSSSSSPPSLPV